MKHTEFHTNITSKNVQYLHRIVGVFGIVAVSAVLSAIVYYSARRTQSPSAEFTPTYTPTPTALPTPSARNISLEVFNAAGKKGLAGRVADRLSDYGFIILQTGNSDTYESSSIVYVREIEPQDLELLTAVLREEFDIITLSHDPIDTTASARVIIGRDVVY